MSFFAVEKRKISKVWPHPNADRLDLAQVEGLTFQFVCQRGTQVEGGEVIFFPIDSVLPQPLIDFFGIGSMLSGKDHNRIRTVKLRGEYGQGFVSAIDRIKEYLKVDELPEDLTTALGVTKFEPPEVMVQNAKLIPIDMSVYDIEGCDRYQNVVDYLMDKDVVITEKVEGMNMHLTLKADGSTKCGQRKFYIISNDPEQPHSFEVASNKVLLPLSKQIQVHNGKDVRIRAEFLGESSQGNYYGFKGHRPMVFEIDIDNHPVDAIDLLAMVKAFNIDFVPVLFTGKLRDFLGGRTVQEACTGQSQLVNKLREGIVIRPFHEEYLQGFGRVIIKQRSAPYLDKTGF